MKAHHENGTTHSKQFSGLVHSIMDDDEFPQNFKMSHIRYFTKESDMIWSKGQSIVISSELLGPASLSRFGNNLLNGLNQVLPTERKNAIKESTSTVVLNYRSGRLEHLVSVWGQFKYKNNMKILKMNMKIAKNITKVAEKNPKKNREKATENKVTFSEWMCSMDCSLPEPKLNLNVVNTLGQAAVYREASYRIVVVDTGGVERDGLDLANVPACEILGVACVNGVPEHMDSVKRRGVSKKDKRRYPGDGAAISERISQEINGILKRMDCSYEHFLVDENIRILHLSDMFSNCSKWSEKPAINEKQACSLIQNVLECGHNETFEYSQHFNERSDRLIKQMNETNEYSPIGTEEYYEPIDWLTDQTEHIRSLDNLKKEATRTSTVWYFLLIGLVLLYHRQTIRRLLLILNCRRKRSI